MRIDDRPRTAPDASRRAPNGLDRAPVACSRPLGSPHRLRAERRSGGRTTRRAAALALLAAAALLPLGLTAAPQAGEAPQQTVKRFKHGQHAAVLQRFACTDCHPSQKNGQLGFPAPDHAPCANSGCHKAEYADPDSQLCYGCHESNLPFAPNPTRSLPVERSEFDGGFSHQRHLSLSLLADNQNCEDCHRRQAGKPDKASPGWLSAMHETCGRCHSGSKPPTMLDCTSCHVAKGGTEAAATANKWRVDARFGHDDHRVDVRTARRVDEAKVGWAAFDKNTAQPLDCATCHADAAAAEGRVPRPPMKLCATCHDGQHSFKTTGFDCARCHGQP